MMIYVPSLNTYTFILSVCLFTSCSFKIPRNDNNLKQIDISSQKAIFIYLDQCIPYKKSVVGNGSIKIDPFLTRREKLIQDGKIYYNYSLPTELLKRPVSKASYQLAIPDSLLYKYALIDSSENYEHDYSIIHQFSPLLPTKFTNIFFMEHAFWANSCIQDDCYRMIVRQYIVFKILKKIVVCHEGFEPRNISDVIGLGSFKKKKMEEALPGEKIKFGGEH